MPERAGSARLASSRRRRRRQMSQTLTIDQRIEVPRRFMAEVFNGQNPEGARNFFTADARWHGPSIAEVTGVDNIVALLGAFIGALSDIRAEEQDAIASGDLVALRLGVAATPTRDMPAVPDSGPDAPFETAELY